MTWQYDFAVCIHLGLLAAQLWLWWSTMRLITTAEQTEEDEPP